MKIFLSLILAVSAWAALETNCVEQITRLKGAWNPAEGVLKWGFDVPWRKK
jgi:hypothetical protein